TRSTRPDMRPRRPACQTRSGPSSRGSAGRRCTPRNWASSTPSAGRKWRSKPPSPATSQRSPRRSATMTRAGPDGGEPDRNPGVRLARPGLINARIQSIYEAWTVCRTDGHGSRFRPIMGEQRRVHILAQSNLPVLSAEGGLSRYLQEIRKFPMLEPDEEFMLAKRYKEHGDTEAAQKLITSHLRLVAKIAMGYRGYGLPISEVISEGNVGLMHAVKRFEPDKGFRLATYAMWWIRAAIQEYVLRSWSLVKIGTTAAQKRLFFNLRKVKGQIAA